MKTIDPVMDRILKHMYEAYLNRTKEDPMSFDEYVIMYYSYTSN